MTLASELAQKLYDAAALLRIALASQDGETTREAHAHARATVVEVQARSADGALTPKQASRLQPLLHTVACLAHAAAHPELVEARRGAPRVSCAG